MRKSLTNTIGFITLFITSYSAVLAQDGTIKGKVQTREELLQAATVSVGKKTVITNAAGEFSVQTKPGTYIITVSNTGYQTKQQEVKIKAGETIELNFILERAGQLNEVVLLGSRSAIQRSSMNSPVPVDVIRNEKLSVGLSDLTQQLFIAIPSFNSPPQTVGSTAYVNPATLRGLGTDETLVLLNGRRRHSSATIFLQYSLGYGSVATDLNSIPAAAIEDVQVLRDGAAAQYGSDAIAGVIDIRLKKSTVRTIANLHLGQFYKGDGETVSFDINRGFTINKKGFINFTVLTRFSKPTQRNGIYDSTVYYNIPVGATQQQKDVLNAKDDSMVLAKGFDRLNRRRIGSPQIFNTSLIINGGYPVSKRANLFWTGTINYRYVADRGSNAYRYPKSMAQVITELYPDGFQPEYFVTTFNTSIIAGIEGETRNGWQWDISSVYGLNSNEVFLTNSNNASQYLMGKNAQTCFETGMISFSQNTNNINFTKSFTKPAHQIRSFTVSYGGEFRSENYRIKQGEEASWKDYAPGSGRQLGSQGVGGYSDSNAVNKNRYVSAAYLELEMDKTEKFLWNLAARYEHYNDFGGNLAGKIAARYKFSDRLLLRGSFSNGFRAPSIQQRYFSNKSAMLAKNLPEISVTETFRNDSYTAQAFGVGPLEAEKSLNISGGITSKISKHVNITLDAYRIQINNRVILTGLISRTASPWVDNILKSLNKNDVFAVRFFTNAVSTRTKGVDLVATGSWPIRKSILDVSVSGNYNKTNIYQVSQPAKNLPDDSLHQFTLINREERGRLEHAQPLSKIILDATYKTGKWEFNFRTVYFGKAAHLAATRDSISGLFPDEFFSPKILSGFVIGYSPGSWLTIKAGARNIFNNYPDKIKNRINTQAGLVIYDFNSTQVGYNGGYYFLNLAFSW